MYKSHWPLLPLTVVFLLIVLTNFPHTSLIGWDNLLTEVNPLLNLKRSIFSTWQEYQGLGLLPGNSPAADIPRQFFLLPLELIFPQQSIRPLETFFLLGLGTLGMYVFLTMLFANYKDSWKIRVSILFGSLFYLLNLATIQTFFVPFEPFLFQFAFLPLLFATVISYLLSPTPKKLLFFAIVSFFATSQAQVPTIFLVTTLALTVTVVVCNLFIRDKVFLTNSLKLLGAFLSLNAFWLLPFFLFVTTRASVVTNSKINEMATQIVILQNKEFGTLHNTALLEGFWFNNIDPLPNGAQTYMFEPWRTYIGNPFIQLFGYFFFGIILLGLVYLVWTKKPLLLAFGVLFLVSFTCLATDSMPFSSVTTFLQQHIPLWEEAFRFPFTKFSLLAGFCFSILFSFGIFLLLRLLPEVKQKFYFLLFLSLSLLIFIFPVFFGNLFYNREKQTLSSDYRQVFSFFQKQDPNTRIADFPQFSFWGWSFSSWEYSGSGFLWYGIKQPILDRAFDVWSPESENYYWEIDRAITTNNQQAFQAVCNKYTISWLVLDKNMVNVENQRYSATDFEKFFTTLSFVHKEAQFGNVILYKVALSHPPTSFISLANDIPTINGYNWSDNDIGYQMYGDYATSAKANIYYPFRSLFTNQTNPLPITNTLNTVLLSATIPSSKQTGTLLLPHLQKNVPFLPFTIVVAEGQDVVMTKRIRPADVTQDISITIPPNIKPLTLTVVLPKTNLFQALLTDVFSPYRIRSCNPLRTGTISAQFEENSLFLASTNATACVTIPIPVSGKTQGYLLTLDTQNTSGRPLHVWVETDTAKEALLDTFTNKTPQLSQNTYIFPSTDSAKRYTVHVENISIGNSLSANNLQNVQFVPLPYNELTTLQLRWDNSLPNASYTTPGAVTHPNPTLYTLTAPALTHTTTIFLSQAYSPFWKLYAVSNTIPSWFSELVPFWVGKPIGQHILINNWANGWQITSPPNTTLKSNDMYIIIFLPQYVEYLGFAILIATFLFLALKQKPFLIFVILQRMHEGNFFVSRKNAEKSVENERSPVFMKDEKHFFTHNDYLKKLTLFLTMFFTKYQSREGLSCLLEKVEIQSKR